VVVHCFELFSQLDGLVEVLFLLLLSTFVLDLDSSLLDGLIELSEAMLVCIQLHILPCFHEGRDQLTAGLAHEFKIIDRVFGISIYSLLFPIKQMIRRA
jgi:hypothetical protein